MEVHAWLTAKKMVAAGVGAAIPAPATINPHMPGDYLLDVDALRVLPGDRILSDFE